MTSPITPQLQVGAENHREMNVMTIRRAVAAKRLRPETPIVLLTGFGELMSDHDERPEGVDLIVSKPITLAALRAAMTRVIAA